MNKSRSKSDNGANNEILSDDFSVIPDDSAVGGMSDAAIESANKDDNETPEKSGAFRYRPTQLTADIIARTSTTADMSKNDVVTLALILLQSVDYNTLVEGITSLNTSKALEVLSALRKA